MTHSQSANYMGPNVGECVCLWMKWSYGMKVNAIEIYGCVFVCVQNAELAFAREIYLFACSARFIHD